MIGMEKKMGWYAVITASVAPVWLVTDHPVASVSWLLGNAFAYSVAWFYLKGWDKEYRNAMIEAISLLPDTPEMHTTRFQLLDNIMSGMPVEKMNRWLGYLIGRLVTLNVVTEEKAEEKLRPIFNRLDFGKKLL